jgi:hypothetical protein
VRLSDWSITTYPVDFNVNGNQNMIYVPAPWDWLVCFGSGGPFDYANDFMIYYSRIVNGVPQAFQKVTTNTAGTRVPDVRAGGQWSTILNCIVSYPAAGSTSVYKLTLPDPASNGSGTWTWTNETLVGVSGAVPSQTTSNNNGAWGRFIEIPAASCFLWCDSVAGPVQAWRLNGM